MIQTKGVVHFTIPVKDLRKSEKFYTDVFGFKIVRKNDHMIFMQSGGDKFVLTYSAKPIDPNPAGQHEIHTAFRVDPAEYDRSLKFLNEKGIKVFKEEARDTGTFTGRSAYFLDPDNNVLEIIDQTNA